jgi:hypothetical protein
MTMIVASEGLLSLCDGSQQCRSCWLSLNLRAALCSDKNGPIRRKEKTSGTFGVAIESPTGTGRLLVLHEISLRRAARGNPVDFVETLRRPCPLCRRPNANAYSVNGWLAGRPVEP